MKRRLVDIPSAVLAAVLCLGSAPVRAQNVAARAAVPVVGQGSSAGAVSLSLSSARLGLAPALSAPVSLAPALTAPLLLPSASLTAQPQAAAALIQPAAIPASPIAGAANAKALVSFSQSAAAGDTDGKVQALNQLFDASESKSAGGGQEVLSGRLLEIVEDSQKHSFLYHQMTHRTLDDYTRLIGYVSPFPSIIRNGRNNPEFHWIDMGAGMGIAPVESLFFSHEWAMKNGEKYSRINSEAGFFGKDKGWGYSGKVLRKTGITGKHSVTVVSYENIIKIFEKNEWKDASLYENGTGPVPEGVSRFKPILQTAQENPKQYRYLHGRLLAEIPDSELGKADLITDVLGVFAYTEDKIGTLIRYCKLLKGGGAVEIVTQIRKAYITDSGRLLTLGEFLEKKHIPGFKISENGPYLNISVHSPTGKTIEILEKLKARLVLEDVMQGGPTKFTYRFTSARSGLSGK